MGSSNKPPEQKTSGWKVVGGERDLGGGWAWTHNAPRATVEAR